MAESPGTKTTAEGKEQPPQENKKEEGIDPGAVANPQVTSTKKKGHPEIIKVTLPDKASLYSAFMPFIKNGGLFIRTKDKYEMGDEIFILLKLMDQAEKYTIRGKVIWITPKGAQGSLQAGVGIQFSPDTPKEVRNKIETYLAGSAQSDRRTDTM